MRLRNRNAALLGSVAAAAVAATATGALAGGFAIREQSAEFQGAAYGGAAAGVGLSSMYWNPAATAAKTGPGIFSESHYAVLFPEADVTVESATPSVTGNPAADIPAAGIAGLINAAPANSGDIADLALVGASYASYQLTSDLFIGLALNSPFGLETKPTDTQYAGAVLGRNTKLLTFNANPTVAYKVTPGVTVGAGFQLQYGDGTLRFATGVPAGPSTSFEGDGFAYGATAGILIEPLAGTSIGLGWRSQLTQNLEGTFVAGNLGGARFSGEVDIELPDIVTLSFRQSIRPDLRLLGTIEWSNWSRFEDLTVTGGPTGTLASIPTNWEDGWFFSLGGEYDMHDWLTLRAGVAYEISPIRDPEQRLTSIPDADRVWLSAGFTYKHSETTSLDFAYTHIFLENGDFSRVVPGTGGVGQPAAVTVDGFVEARTDIFSASLKTRW